MIKKRQSYSSLLLFKTSRRKTTTCTVPLDLKSISSTPHNDLKSFRFSLVEKLIHCGLIPSAQQVVRRMIKQSPSLSDAIAAANFSISRGVDLDLGSYGMLIRRMIELGQLQLAESLYFDRIIERGIDPNPEIVNSMVICLCKLGKFEEAKAHFDDLMIIDCVQCKVAVNAILREFFKQERFLEAFDVISRINIKLGFWSYNVLIDGLCHQGHLNEALKVLNIMHDRTGSLPTLHLYKSLFFGLCKGGWGLDAEELFIEMESQGFYVDKVMYTSLVKAYCKDNKVIMAMRVYLRMLKTGCEPDSYTKNTMFHGFLKVGLFDKGWAFYNQMEQGIPDAVTYQIMISNFCQAERLDSALMLLKTMVNNSLAPSVHSYTVLIAALYKENMLKEVHELLRDLRDRGVVPDHVLYFILMKNRPREDVLDLAVACLQRIASHVFGFDFDLTSVSTTTIVNTTDNLEWKIESTLEDISRIDLGLANEAFGIFINALCEGGQINAALLCFDKMVKLGCTPLPFTYNSLIKCLCQEGLSEEVESLLADMQCRGIVPDMTTYLIMVNTCCKRGDLDFAFDVLNLMDEKGLKPNVAIYDSMISCLSRNGSIFDAEDMFKRMLKDGVDPDEIVFMTMINGYSMNGMALDAQDLFEQMIEILGIKPSSYSYTALVSGLVKEKMTDQGCFYLERMLGDGHGPNRVLYTSLINSFFRNGEFGFALRLFDLMDRSHIEQDLILQLAMVSGVSRNIVSTTKRWFTTDVRYERTKEMLFNLLKQEALVPRKNILKVSTDSLEQMKHFALEVIIKKVEESNFMPNLYLYNGIIYGFCRADRIEDAYEHFELMQSEGIYPNEVTFTILIGKHIRDGEIDRAIHLFNVMNAAGCTPDRTTYHTLLKGLCHFNRLYDAFSLLYAMRKRGLFPYKGSYEKMLNCLCARNLSVPAFRIFEEMLSHDYVPGQLSIDRLLRLLHEEKRLEEADMVLLHLPVYGLPQIPQNTEKAKEMIQQ